MSSPQGNKCPFNYIWIGVIAGLLVAGFSLAWGFWGLVYAVFLTAIGGVLGAHFEGRIDIRRAFEVMSNGGRG